MRAFFDLYDAGVQLGIFPRRGGMAERAMWIARGFGLRRGQDVTVSVAFMPGWIVQT